jgi:peptidoglycan-N-acetylglucosamine deacetylase
VHEVGDYPPLLSAVSLSCMHRYFIKIPWIVKKCFPRYTWSIPPVANEVYLTFDDGPHPRITPWVLEQLAAYEAKATFFCIGDNVVKYPDTYRRLIAEGHSVGNHTQNHLNGWTVPPAAYLDNIREAASHIHSTLFRPPYGRIRSTVVPSINNLLGSQAQIIMWEVLSADFDRGFTPEQCLKNVLSHTEAGSIIVFHDSEKAFPNLEYCLPRVLESLSRKGYQFKGIEERKN